MDRARLRAIVGTAVEEAKANDPKELKEEIARLKTTIRSFENKPGPPGATREVEKRVEVPVLSADDRNTLDSGVERIMGLSVEMRALQNQFDALLRGIESQVGSNPSQNQFDAALRGRSHLSVAEDRPAAPAAKAPTPRSPRPSKLVEGGLSRPERAFLTVLQRSVVSRSRDELALLAVYSKSSGHVDNTLGRLRSRGYIDGSRAGYTITQAGSVALGDPESIPEGEALVKAWLSELNLPERSMLEVLVAVFPSSLPRDELAVRTGYSTTSGHVDNTIGALRRMGLITGGRQELRMHETLNPE